MKIKLEKRSLAEVLSLPRPAHVSPKKPNMLFRTLMRLASEPDLRAVKFSAERACDDLLNAGPCLILMNHSSFVDLEIASGLLYPKPFGIVCTSDGFVGREWLMRSIGCIPTRKFVNDMTLIRDMKYALEKEGMHVLMYPEASYSFDGCATPLPKGLGRLIKMLNVPVIMIRTYGAFSRDPLYNCLQKRRVKVSARMYALADAAQVKAMTVPELDKILDEAFCFDSFAWQKENGIQITEDFRADGLERILYKCSDCGAEGTLLGKGTGLCCSACGKRWQLTELGELRAESGETRFSHIPDWYAWEREEVKKELQQGSYRLDTKVKIGLMVDYKAIYQVGEGRLQHTGEGFFLSGCEGSLTYTQKPGACYGLYADYYWYETGDIICIGNHDCLYYCWPEQQGVVAKTRLAAEELFKMNRAAQEKSKREE